MGQSTYAKEKPASIGINACRLVLVATKIANGGGLAPRASQSLLRLLSRSSANRHSRKDLRWLESWPGGLLPARSVNPWITASMAKVIPLFPGRPPGGLDRSEQLDDLRCRLADQEAAIKALNDQLHELVFCLLTREPA